MSYPDIPVVVISGTDQRGDIEAVLNSGASGFISKLSSGQDMLHALRLVLDGGVYIPPQLLRQTFEQMPGDKRSIATNDQGLTPRQMDVLKQLTLGLSNREISIAVGLAEGTVKVHVAAIYQALRVTNGWMLLWRKNAWGCLRKIVPNGKQSVLLDLCSNSGSTVAGHE